MSKARQQQRLARRTSPSTATHSNLRGGRAGALKGRECLALRGDHEVRHCAVGQILDHHLKVNRVEVRRLVLEQLVACAMLVRHVVGGKEEAVRLCVRRGAGETGSGQSGRGRGESKKDAEATPSPCMGICTVAARQRSGLP